MGTLGYLVLLSSNPRPQDNVNLAITSHTVSLVVFMLVYLTTRPFPPAAQVSSLGVHKLTPVLLFGFLVLGCLGAYLVTLRLLDLSLLFSNPFASRAVNQAVSPSGIAWLLYKLLLPVAVATVALSARKLIGRGTSITVLSMIALMYVVYGARLQPLLLILLLVLSWNSFSKPISTGRIFVGASILALVAVLFAGYRYFSTYGLDLDKNRIEATFVRQAGGTVGELGETTSVVPVPSMEARRVLEHEIYYKTIPGILRKSSVLDRTTFGGYVALKQGRPESGGLRVGPVGESLLAYGWLGPTAVGALLALFSRGLDRLLASRRAAQILVSIVGTTQLMFVYITGVANLASSAALLIVSAVFAALVFPSSRGDDLSET